MDHMGQTSLRYLPALIYPYMLFIDIYLIIFMAVFEITVIY